MKSEKLKIILAQHMLWLNGNGGERANLRDANLRGADLREANLQRADLRGADLLEANLRWANLRGADLRGANLREANLQWANLRGTDLRGADLRGADLDFASFPLWCECAHFKCDQKLVYQLLAHICTLDFDDTEGIQELVLPFAIKSHRAKDLGLIGDEKARGERYCHSEYGSANCKWEPGIGCTPKCPECIPEEVEE